MTSLAELAGSFAALLKPAPGNHARLGDWIFAARSCDLPSVHAFTRGLDLDQQTAIAAVTLPCHNGRTEGVNTKTKLIKTETDVRTRWICPPPPPHPARVTPRAATTKNGPEPFVAQ